MGPNVAASIDVGEPGEYNITILSITIGLVNYAQHMETWRRGITGNVTVNGVDITGKGWTVKDGMTGEFLKYYTEEGASIVKWNHAMKTELGPLSWIKFEFDVPENISGPLSLTFDEMNKGQAWINGQSIGRYWTIGNPNLFSSCSVVANVWFVCSFRGIVSSVHCLSNWKFRS